MQAHSVVRWSAGVGGFVARLFDAPGQPTTAPAIPKSEGSGTRGHAGAPGALWSDFTRSAGADKQNARLNARQETGLADILVPVDFSPASLMAAECALRFAQKAGARVTFLHVIHLNLTPYGPGNPTLLKAALRREADSKVASLADRARAAGVECECRIEEGVPARVIAHVAGRRNSQLILMAAPKRGRIARLFRGRTLGRVVRDARCPVLVLQTNAGKGIL